MKKKQKEKLMKAFRPSFDSTRQKLFRHLEQTATKLYNLDITASLNPKNHEQLLVVNNTPGTETKPLIVPIDETFVSIIKRVQKQEKAVLEQFTTNLTHEIASYWYVPATEATIASASAPSETAPAQETAAALVDEPASTNQETAEEKAPEAKTAASAESTEKTAALTTAAFTKAMEEFPKFFVTTAADQILVKEKTAKEDRLLATIGTQKVGEFTIEKALDRKYKLKTEVIPVIEAFANTPLAQR